VDTFFELQSVGCNPLPLSSLDEPGHVLLLTRHTHLGWLEVE